MAGAAPASLLPQAVVDAVGFGCHPLVPTAYHVRRRRRWGRQGVGGGVGITQDWLLGDSTRPQPLGDKNTLIFLCLGGPKVVFGLLRNK